MKYFVLLLNHNQIHNILLSKQVHKIIYNSLLFLIRYLLNLFWKTHKKTKRKKLKKARPNWSDKAREHFEESFDKKKKQSFCPLLQIAIWAANRMAKNDLQNHTREINCGVLSNGNIYWIQFETNRNHIYIYFWKIIHIFFRSYIFWNFYWFKFETIYSISRKDIL